MHSFGFLAWSYLTLYAGVEILFVYEDHSITNKLTV